MMEEIRLGETLTLEFKRVPNVDRVKYQKTAAAFAYGLGGRILFGVANDHCVVGVAPVSMEVFNGEVRLNVHRKTEKVHMDSKKEIVKK